MRDGVNNAMRLGCYLLLCYLPTRYLPPFLSSNPSILFSFQLRDLKTSSRLGVAPTRIPPRTLLNPRKINMFCPWTFKSQYLRSSDVPRHPQDATGRPKTAPRLPTTRLRHLQVTILVDFETYNGTKLTQKSHPGAMSC